MNTIFPSTGLWNNLSNVFYDFQATAREDRYCWELEL